MAENPIPIEEEKKLITVNTYMDKLSDKQFAEVSLENKKEKLVFGIRKCVNSLAIEIMDIRKNEDFITEKLADEVLSNIYAQDPLYPYVHNYINSSKKIFNQHNDIINSLCEFVLDITQTTNDVIETAQSKSPSPKTAFDDGTPQLKESEREALKANVHSLVLYYKESNSAAKNSILYQLDQMADTKEKFAIMDDAFFELTGERALEAYRKNKQEVPS